jgi:peptidoglycan/xylan/chitin deacetylase (PgdA/CDA1 family)
MRTLLFRVGRLLGLFALSRVLTGRALRILCYHGFSLTDEHDFRPKLFITAERFERRLDYLRSRGYRVVSLEQALDELRSGALPRNTVVITIDDGFYSVRALALPLLQRFDFPSTLYLTTYYVEHQSPVFRLALQYLFWKSTAPFVNLTGLGQLAGLPTNLEHVAVDSSAEDALIEHGESLDDEAARQGLLDELARRLDVDLASVRAHRRLSLVTVAEARDLVAGGMDVQLHTHRHRMPDRHDDISAEIWQNRAVVQQIAPGPHKDFCYPSGVWRPEHWPVLESLGIRSATTCMPGLNSPRTSPLALRRFLDAENISDLEFDAEVSGFKELLRRAKARAVAWLDGTPEVETA